MTRKSREALLAGLSQGSLSAVPSLLPAPYQLVRLTASEVVRWDELIAGFEAGELFHQRPWLDYLKTSRGLDLRYWRILEGTTAVGYFCGALIRKGPFRVLGSPLKGWGTNFMGPVVQGELDQPAFLHALDDLAAHEHLAMIEIEYRGADGAALRERGYVPVADMTYVVTLTPESPEPMWLSLKSTCRNRIRKAMSHDLAVECTRDQAIAEEFYDQFLPIMLRQGFAPPYPREHARQLVRHLMGKDLLLALRVRDRAGQTIATGLFPHDQRTMYFWGGASVAEARKQCPNELMHWTAMRLAAAKGVREYNMCGPGAFKRKFGGSLLPTTRWHKSYSPYAEPARKLYQTYFQARMRVHAWLFRACSLPFSSTDRFPLRHASHEPS